MTLISYRRAVALNIFLNMKKHKLPGYINGNYSFVKLHLCHLFPISLKFVGIDKTVQPATLLQQLPLRGMQKKQEGGGSGHKRLERREGAKRDTLSGSVTRGRGHGLTMPTNTIQWRIRQKNHVLAPNSGSFHKKEAT